MSCFGTYHTKTLQGFSYQLIVCSSSSIGLLLWPKVACFFNIITEPEGKVLQEVVGSNPYLPSRYQKKKRKELSVFSVSLLS